MTCLMPQTRSASVRRSIAASLDHGLSRTLRERFGDAIELQVLDPRNPALAFLLLRDFWAFRVGLVEAMKTIGRLPIQAVVVNGQLISRGEWPDPLEVVQLLEETISAGVLEPA